MFDNMDKNEWMVLNRWAKMVGVKTYWWDRLMKKRLRRKIENVFHEAAKQAENRFKKQL